MIKEKTADKYLNIFKSIADGGLKKYCVENNLSIQTIYNLVHDAKEDPTAYNGKIQQLLSEYSRVSKTKEVIDTTSRAEISYSRDADGEIVSYDYCIYKKNKTPLVGTLSLDEMTSIYRLYSCYGDNLPAKSISRYFSDLSTPDLKRILSAFSIFKVSSPFPPHFYERYTDDELRAMQLQERENGFLRKAEEDRIKDNERLLRKYAKENIELQNQINNISNLSFSYKDITPYNIPEVGSANQSINIYLSDMHLGSMTLKDSLYSENINYGVDEAKRRLQVVLDNLASYGTFRNMNIILMGDNIDCCGFFGYTASMSHQMPENMQPREQANEYINLVMWFIDSIIANGLTSNIRLFSVPEGNHSGNFEYICNKAIMAMVKAKWPQIETTLWEKFYGVFKQGKHTFICCHGKPAQFKKKGFPLNLDDRTRTLLYEWLDDNHIYGDNIHIIKGDLHSNNMNSCKKFTYRNVLSLYGSSDYSNMNFSRNSYGVSYDLFMGDNIICGTFENI